MARRNTFSTTITDIGRNNTINVESINSFPNRAGDVVTIPVDVKYNFTQSVSLEGIEFVGIGGATAIFTAENIIASTISSDVLGSTALFSGDFSRLIINNIDVTLNSGSGKLFDIISTISTFPVIEIKVGVLSGNGDDLGSISGSLVDFEGCAINNWGSGFVFGNNGNIGRTGIKVRNSIFSNSQFKCVILFQ